MNLNDMTKAQIVEHAKTLGLELNQKDNKDTLIAQVESALIDQAFEQNSEGEAEKGEALEQQSQPNQVESQSAKPIDNNHHPKFAKFKKGNN